MYFKSYRLKKIVTSLLLVIILVSNFTPNVYADTDSATGRTSSMISFFREGRTGLDVDSVSRDEVVTYGIFMSNFFIPGVTTVGDIGNVTKKETDENGDQQDKVETTTLATRLSENFFGNSGNAETVQKINNKVYETLTNGFSNNLFDLTYKSGNDTGALTGRKFLELMGKTGKRTLHIKNGSEMFDLNTTAVNASLKVMYGINPNFMLNEGGLRDCGKMFVDGFGNIWAEPVSTGDDGVDRGGSSNTYILVLPACLNPAVFGAGDKFPVVNSFVMGNILNIDSGMFQRESSSINPIEPYYNVAKYLSSDDDCLGSMLNIFGIESPSLNIGKSDNILSNYNSIDKTVLNNFASSNSKGAKDKSGLMLAINPLSNKTGFTIETIKKSLELIVSDKQERLNMLKYLNNSIFVPYSSLADEMTYFNFGWEGSYSNAESNWTSVSEPIIKQSLFSQAKQTESQLNFYNNSYAFSPLHTLLDSGKSNELVSSVEVQGFLFDDVMRTKPTEKTNLSNFKTGMKKLVGDKPIGDVIAKPFYSEYVADGWLGIISSLDKFTIGYGLTENDSTILTSNTRDESWGNVSASLPSNDAFDFSGGRGSIKSDGAMTGTIVNKRLLNVEAYFRVFYDYKLFGMVHEVRDVLSGDAAGKTYGSYTLASNIANGVNHWPGIYWGYMTDLLNITNSSTEEGTTWGCTPFYNNRLPEMSIKTNGGNLDLNASLGNGSSGLSSDDNKTEEEMYKDVLKKVYGILSPEENEYRNNWIKATLDSWIISLHRSITGSWVGNVLSVSSGVMNSYSSVVGYINTPTLMDLPVTNWIMSNYMSIYILLLLIILIILTMMTFVGLRTIRKSLLVFILMCFVLLLPNTFLNNAISFSNSVTDSMFSDRFNYWAITQHQQSIQGLGSAEAQGDLISIIQQNIEKADNVYSQDPGVRLKWMSPKKNDMFNTFFTQSLSNSSMSTNLTIFNWLFSSFFNQEEYVYGDNLITYLYRPYNDIARSAKDSYESPSGSMALSTLGVALREKQEDTLSSADYEFKMVGRELNDSDLNVQYSEEQKDLIESVRLLKTGSGNSEYKGWVGASSTVTNKIFEETYECDSSAGLSNSDIEGSSGHEFLLLTESPFYYFYNVLRDNYASGSGGSVSFKNKLLSEEMFIVKDYDNTKVTNKMRDFLDIEGLFTNIIPYLNQSNEYVINWIKIYDDDVPEFDFTNGSLGENGNVDDFNYAKQKKDSLEQVWNLYSPWVDMLHDLDIYNKKVSVARKNKRIQNSLNPGAYDEVGRPMVWSEADMYAKNFKTHELTEVERKIQEVQEKTYIDLMYLLNYYDFDDEVLLTMGAMMATFNFNEVFSDNQIFGESVMLYPQGFELKNFNYDAFMRMTLMNATGEPLMHKKDLYSRVLSKTSLITGLLLLAEDVIAVIVIPAIKLLTMLLIVFVGLLLCISCIVNPPEKILQTVSKVIIIPTLLFTLCNIGFAFIVSIFLGEGITLYTGSKLPSLATNDPTITILLLVLAGCVYIYCMFKVLKVLFSTFKTFGLGVLFTTLGIVAGAGATLFAKAKNRVRSTYRGVSGNFRGNRMARRHGKLMAEGMEDYRSSNDSNSGNLRSSGSGNYSQDTNSNNGMLDANTSPTTDKALQCDINDLVKDKSPMNLRSTEKATESFETQNDKPLDQAIPSTTENITSDEDGQVISERKTFGQKVVDFKYGALGVKDKFADAGFATKDYFESGKAKTDIKETAQDIASKTKTAGGYVMSGKAFHDTTDATKKGIKTVDTKVREGLHQVGETVVDTTVGVYDKKLQPTIGKVTTSINNARDYERQLQLQRSDKLKNKLGDVSKASELDKNRYNRESVRTAKVIDKDRLSSTNSKIESLRNRKNVRDLPV